MQASDSNLLDTVLFIVVAGAMAVLVFAALCAAVETWRRRSDDRRIRNHLRK
jgi:hypothetical protein